jgi:hypothetical protein
MTNQVILTDVDGVLLNWEDSFNRWMIQKNFILVDPDAYHVHTRFNIKKEESKYFVRRFNESAQIGYLSPFRDSINYVQLLSKKMGYKFHCITSLSKDDCAQKLRIYNLENVFGKHIFERFLFADTGQDKNHLLKEYDNSGYIWVEDKPINAEDGLKYGLNCVLVDHVYNQDYSHPYVKRVKSWRDIFDKIIKDS